MYSPFLMVDLVLALLAVTKLKSWKMLTCVLITEIIAKVYFTVTSFTCAHLF